MWRVIVTFALVALIIYLSYAFSKGVGKGMSKSRSSRYMRLIDQITVGQDRYLAIVQVGTKYLLVGITAGQVNVLSEIQDEELFELIPQTDVEEKKVPDFKAVLTKLGEAGKKRR